MTHTFMYQLNDFNEHQKCSHVTSIFSIRMLSRLIMMKLIHWVLKNMFISKLLISLFWSWDSLLFCLLFNLLDAQEKVSICKYIQSEYVRWLIWWMDACMDHIYTVLFKLASRASITTNNISHRRDYSIKLWYINIKFYIK